MISQLVLIMDLINMIQMLRQVEAHKVERLKVKHKRRQEIRISSLKNHIMQMHLTRAIMNLILVVTTIHPHLRPNKKYNPNKHNNKVMT
jgi:hypothetical protein